VLQTQTAHQEVARRRYLTRLRRYCQSLPLPAMGGEVGADQEITLDQVYIALDIKRVPGTAASAEMDTEKLRDLRRYRDLRYRALRRHRTRSANELAEMDEEAFLLYHGLQSRREPKSGWQTALEATEHIPKLVLLGDPGAGKSTFVHMLLAWLATVHLEDNTPPPSGVPGDLLPILVTLRDLAPRLADLDLKTLSYHEREHALAVAVRDHILADLARLEAAGFTQEMQEILNTGRCLLVLDGMDEVPHDLRRHTRDAVAAVVGEYGIERVIVTCRVRSYTEEAVLPDFLACLLVPFNPTTSL
jgi:hypothetical protein